MNTDKEKTITANRRPFPGHATVQWLSENPDYTMDCDTEAEDNDSQTAQPDEQAIEQARIYVRAAEWRAGICYE
ncbi:MAG: hypothetical protein FWD33_02250 [Alphaproteobacteria bacterium]|nr:hypothetical protein [Alphaproteobacteria bacterium]